MVMYISDMILWMCLEIFIKIVLNPHAICSPKLAYIELKGVYEKLPRHTDRHFLSLYTWTLCT